MIQSNTTYIEKPIYYKENRVVIVARVKDGRVYGQYINMDTGKASPTVYNLDEFEQRFELSPIQMHT